MLSENIRVRAKIQSAFEQLAMPHVAKVRFGNFKVQGNVCTTCTAYSLVIY